MLVFVSFTNQLCIIFVVITSTFPYLYRLCMNFTYLLLCCESSINCLRVVLTFTYTSVDCFWCLLPIFQPFTLVLHVFKRFYSAFDCFELDFTCCLLDFATSVISNISIHSYITNFQLLMHCLVYRTVLTPGLSRTLGEFRWFINLIVHVIHALGYNLTT